MAIGLMISFRLQRSITAPLVALTRTMAAVRESHDYRATVEVKSDDEIGSWSSSFNGMIGEIRERDIASRSTARRSSRRSPIAPTI